MPRGRLRYYGKGLLFPLLFNIFLQLIFAAIFVGVEGWNYREAFYHCIVTATTVGYGDISIATDGGKWLAVFHILVSCTLLAAAVSDVGTLMEERAATMKRLKLFSKRLDVSRPSSGRARRFNSPASIGPQALRPCVPPLAPSAPRAGGHDCQL